jgi:hypothetical protein
MITSAITTTANTIAAITDGIRVQKLLVTALAIG